MDQTYFQRMPKIDLHCHLDGSLPLATLRKLADRAGISIPHRDEELAGLVTAPADCTSLIEYLRCFSLAVSCLQTPDNLYEAAYDLVADVARENVAYLEVRFAPMLSVHNKLPPEIVVDSVLHGLAAARRNFGVGSGVILCAMRDQPQEVNQKVLEEAERFFGRGVVGVDLAGDEKTYPAAGHRLFFQRAAALEIPFTIHAGEADGPASVKAALELGAKRIGHGIAMGQDPELMDYCGQHAIGIEMCPVSNLQTKAAASWSEYPFRTFYDKGLLVTINTDNRTVSGTTLTREFTELSQAVGLDSADADVLYRNAVQCSFAGPAEKKELLERHDRFKAQEAEGESR